MAWERHGMCELAFTDSEGSSIRIIPAHLQQCDQEVPWSHYSNDALFKTERESFSVDIYPQITVHHSGDSNISSFHLLHVEPHSLLSPVTQPNHVFISGTVRENR
jgi:hypothetical protein